jgi:hypothetical protein
MKFLTYIKPSVLTGIRPLLLIGLFLPLVALSATPEIGKTYFTQYNFKVENERHLTTNYWRGELIPLNSEVVLEVLSGNEMVIAIDGRRIRFENVRKFTLRNIEEIAEELLSPKKVDIPGNSEQRDDIESGTLALGMTKEQVLMTRGYPPRHKTASTKASRWVYWSSRFVQLTLVFREGVLVEGRGLR